MRKISLNSNWTMNRVGQDRKIKATVPGSVHGDLLAAGEMENPYWKDNEIEALKLMESDYEYRTSFRCDDAFLESDEIILRFEFSVKELLQENNELLVLFHSPTKYIQEAFEKAPTLGTEDAMNGFVHLRKAHYMFGWDWGAHLPDAGIWRPVYLLGIDMARLEGVEVLQYHEEDRVRLEILPEIQYASFGEEVCEPLSCLVSITAPDGSVVVSNKETNEVTIANPMLWWPNGFGEQNLYTVKVDLYTKDDILLDTWERRIGLRTITMDRSKDAWGQRPLSRRLVL